MAQEAQIKSHNERNAWKTFDQVLGQHIERLIGSRYGIGGLPMTSKTLSCLILVMERENEIQASSAPAPERYTPDTLQHELNTLGFALSQDIDTLTRDMVEKGYFNLGDNGCLVPQKPARSMTQLLDRILPGMPGMNFVAYCIQTVDEVKTERKTLPEALSQFDQTLQIQGIPIKGEQSPTKSKKASSPVPGRKKQMPEMVSALQKQPRPSQMDARKPSYTLDSLKSKIRSENSAFSPERSKILSQNAYSGPPNIREVHFGKPTSDKKASEEFKAKTDSEIEPQKSQLQTKTDQEQPSSETPLEEIEAAIPSDPTPLEADISAPDLPVFHQGPAIEKTDAEIDTVTAAETAFNTSSSKAAGTTPEVEIEKADTEIDTTTTTTAEAALKAVLLKAAGTTPEAENETDIASQPEDVDRSDEIIAKRIASFEEDLAMECPLCHRSRIRAHETASGKNYYKCSNQTCDFVTWGKPYHFQCPRCSNPFLIEVSGKDGITILKCPRATCHHWQNPAGEGVGQSQASGNSETAENKNGTVSARKPRRRRVRRKRVRRIK